MTRMDRTRSASIALVGTAAIAALASFTPSTASAADYDMDCKLILCMPAGFPGGCGDAFDHMVDRLRDGKSPIGFCGMSNGAEYDDYDIDYVWRQPTSREAWQCPPGKTLFHEVTSDGEGFFNRSVTTFCYDTAYERRTWTGPDGYQTTLHYTNMSPPEHKNFWVNLTLEPDAAEPITRGWQKFDTGMRSSALVQYTP